MKTVLFRFALFGAFSVVPFLPLSAQPAAPASPVNQEAAVLFRSSKPGSPEDIARRMNEAFAFRTGLAKAVVAGEKTPANVLLELNAPLAPGRSQPDGATDYALALVDLGQRMLAEKHPAEAEVFFVEADKALGRALAGLEGNRVRERSGLLEHRAHLRSNYLKRVTDARADLAEAAALQPGETRLQRKRETLPAGGAGRNANPNKAN